MYKFQYQGFAYDGEWVAGVKQGRGQMTLPDGSSYNGEFLEGEVSFSSNVSRHSLNYIYATGDFCELEYTLVKPLLSNIEMYCFGR